MLVFFAGSFMSLLPYLLICSAVPPAVLLSSPTCCFAQQFHLLFCSAVNLLQLQASLVCQLHQYEFQASLQAYTRPLQGARQWARPQVPGGLLPSCLLLMAALKVGPAKSSVPFCPCCMQAQRLLLIATRASCLSAAQQLLAVKQRRLPLPHLATGGRAE